MVKIDVLSKKQILDLIDEIQNSSTIDKKSMAREISIYLYGKDDVMALMKTASFLTNELLQREKEVFTVLYVDTTTSGSRIVSTPKFKAFRCNKEDLKAKIEKDEEIGGMGNVWNIIQGEISLFDNSKL